MSCNRQQLNITCGTDVVLHDRLIFDGDTFDPNLSVGIAANLVSSLGKRTSLSVEVVDDELLITVPWVEGRFPGCYGLEVTGSCNSKKWATYADSLIRYTKATVPGESEVTIESDTYDITQEVGYCYSNSPVTFAEVTVDGGYGTPSVDVEYEQRVLSMAFHNLKGNGITDIDVDEQVGDEAVNTVTIKTDADQEGTEFQVRNGSRGNGIASSSESLSDQDGGINTFTITDNDGNTHEFHSKNGTKGSQGDSAVYDPDAPDTPDFVMANTTGYSTTKAMTQKAVTDELDAINTIIHDVEQIDLSSLTMQNCSLGSSKWYMDSNTNAQRHWALEVNPGETFVLDVTSQDHGIHYGFLTSSYSPPYVNNAAIPFVDGTSRNVVSAGEKAKFTIPEGCAFLVINAVDGTGKTNYEAVLSIVSSINVNVQVLEQATEDLAEDTRLYSSVLDDAPINDWKINSSGKWEHGTSYKAKTILVSDYKSCHYAIDGNGVACKFAFVRQRPSANANVSYCNNTGLITAQHAEGYVPIDALYLYVVLDDGVTEVSPMIGIERKLKSYFTKNVFVTEEVIDLSQLTIQNCSLGAASWYMAGSQAQRHMAFEVEEGQTYMLRNTGTVNQMYALLTSSYSPPYTNGNPIPFVSGTDRNVVNMGEGVAVTIPEGCAYVALNVVDGAGYTSSWEVALGMNYAFFDGSNASYSTPKIRVCSWNIGHFALGDSYDTTITHEDYPVMRQKWAEAINGVNADIMLCCEYNTNMVNAEDGEPAITARDAIFSPYKNAYVGTKPSATSYMQTAIFSNMKVSDVAQVTYTHAVQVGRYYQYGIVDICGKHVAVVITHLDFNQGEHGEEYRAEQIQKLITDFSSFDHVVIAGDFNVHTPEEFDAFADAGYEMANHGYLGDLATAVSSVDGRDLIIDNILAKGFKVLNIHVNHDNTLSDHDCIYADLTMI